MKIRTTKYALKEGIINSYRNKMMSLASLSTVVASLLTFGIFLLITLNLNYNTELLRDHLQLEVFCKENLEDAQIDSIEGAVKSNNKIREYKKVTKKEAFEKAKEMLGEDKRLLEGIDENFLPVSFKIYLQNQNDIEQISEELADIPGVSSVKYSQKEFEMVKNISKWIQVSTIILLIVLLIVSTIIIANTIKITVYARRKEINIMKYIGATDWFIRLPFIVEGIIIGLLGAGIGCTAAGYLYHIFVYKVAANVKVIKFISLGRIGITMVLVGLLIGAIVGAMGSMLSMRKHLRV